MSSLVASARMKTFICLRICVFSFKRNLSLLEICSFFQGGLSKWKKSSSLLSQDSFTYTWTLKPGAQLRLLLYPHNTLIPLSEINDPPVWGKGSIETLVTLPHDRLFGRTFTWGSDIPM